jgi:ABC-type transport system involved in cytochrome bd biosynthesis fused ATPase/permease subunit
MVKMWSHFFENSSKWALHKIIFDIIIVLRPYTLIQWFLLTVASMTLTTYLNVSFFSTITININQGLKYLFLLIIFENVTSYCLLKQSLAKKTFVLDFLKHFRTKLNERILSANWIKIKLSDQEEVRRKIEEATSSIQYLVEEFIEQLREISKFITTIITIFYICPIATILIGIVYVCFYRFHLNKQSNDLLDIKLKMIEKHDKLYSKYSRANANMFEYVIHHEKNNIINVTNELKTDMEKQWFLIDYLYDYLSFKEDILGKLCTFITIVIYYKLNGINTFIIPLYHYLSTLTDSIHTLLVAYIRCLRLKKDYDLIKPILEEYDERINVEQIDLRYEFQIQDLSFQYMGTRETFHLQLNGSLTFKMGETILITGKSGAGKSTFYDILNGSISMNDYSAKIQIDYKQESTTLHSIEKCRTMVLQDSDMDYRSTIYSMITDTDEDEVKQQRTPELELLVWDFLHLVQIDDFVRDELNSDLDQAIENKLSGGQKTRMLLARALYRAHNRNSSLLILDEPDKGLPAETTVTIIENIMKWYRSKGILFLTLHTERAHILNFNQILHIEQGSITKIK